MGQSFRMVAFQLARSAWFLLRYLFVAAALMLATMCFMTGKFPPPVKDVFKSVSNIQKSMDIGSATSNITEYTKKKEALLKNIESDDRAMFVGGPAPADVPKDEYQMALERIRALEYEVALLKSKLHRSEKQVQYLNQRMANTPQ